MKMKKFFKSYTISFFLVLFVTSWWTSSVWWAAPTETPNVVTVLPTKPVTQLFPNDVSGFAKFKYDLMNRKPVVEIFNAPTITAIKSKVTKADTIPMDKYYAYKTQHVSIRLRHIDNPYQSINVSFIVSDGWSWDDNKRVKRIFGDWVLKTSAKNTDVMWASGVVEVIKEIPQITLCEIDYIDFDMDNLTKSRAHVDLFCLEKVK